MRPVPNQPPTRDPGPVRLALVGEAPGENEVALGQPFVGVSGQRLNAWLGSAGLSRSQVLVANVCQMRPSSMSNDFHQLDWNGGAVQEGIAALREDLERFAPHCVLALGNAALHLLRHGNVAPPKSKLRGLFQWSSHIGTWRGSLFEGARSFDPFESADLRLRESERGLASGEPRPTGACIAGHGLDGAPLASPTVRTWKSLSTYHPAATFRDPSFTYPLVSDLRRAVAEARSPALELPRRDITWGWTAAEIEAKCACIREMREPVGFDIEGGLNGLQCCSFALTPSDAFVIDLMNGAAERPALLRALAAVLEDERVPKVCWNAAYERAILQATHGITLRGYEDPMLAWWERFSELPKGLDFVASILTREPYWAEGIGWDRKTGAPKVVGPRFWRYNGTDSCVTLEIWQSALVQAVVGSRTPVAFTL